MMQPITPCMNEAEIRAKVIDVWLRDHGFTPEQIVLEKTFKIRLGRAVYLVGKGATAHSEQYGRSDYLVRTLDRRNLFVIEAKAVGEPLGADSRKQAVSYARLLEDGGIAPFAVLTNGRNTDVIDSITGAVVSNGLIPHDHPYVVAGFRVAVDDLACRVEALEHLISVCPENLLVFCDAQVEYRMSRLRSNDLCSGFKYIPSLYVERQQERKRLLDLTNDPTQKCVLLLGPPQVGKTNFICNFVEEQLKNGTPCLFYPAVAVESGLLDAIGRF